jgi:prepilin-type N-terminal cleavage/methylation domain-containing protein
MPKSGQRAFTLIELMIVVSIIAILAGVLIPNFLHARSESQSAACEGNEKQIATALEEYTVDNGGAFPPSGTVGSTTLGTVYLVTVPKDPVNGSPYSINTTPGTYGSYYVSDSGGHDPTTLRNLPGSPGTGKIVYRQNVGLVAQ